MRRTVFSFLTICFLFSGTVLAEKPTSTRSVTNSARLVELLKLLSNLASEGANLEYFGYEEDFTIPYRGENCYIVNSEEVIKYFKQTASDILSMIGVDVEAYATVIDDFAKVVNSETYMRCDESYTANYSFTVNTYFISQDNKYRIKFELGYEN